jgi:hypothetical protein
MIIRADYRWTDSQSLLEDFVMTISSKTNFKLSLTLNR